MGKLYYSVITKAGKIKSYVDKKWCTCEAHKEAHVHPKRKYKADGL